jgi:ATP-dependent helicase/nuclease subunit A
VIAPDSTQIPDHERRAGLLYTEDCVFFGVPKAMDTPPIVRAKDEARAREMREYRRLLYVALTRAREWLILCGYQTRGEIPEESWYAHAAAAAMPAPARDETIEGETVRVWGAGLTKAAAPVPDAGGGDIALPAFLLAAAAPEVLRPRILRPSDAALSGEPALLSPLADKGARFRRGLLVHALLARLPDLAPQTWRQAALAYLARQGLGADEAGALADETLGVLTHPDFAPLFAPGSRAEIAVAADLPELGRNVRVNGQIDRLAVTDDAVLIADFKTNRPPPSDAAQTPRIYLAQMAMYRAALARIYPARRIDCALIWTDGARLMRLPAHALDAEFAHIAARLAARPTTQDLP